MKTVYLVNWDNGGSACGTFPCEFDTFEEADQYGKAWADEFNRLHNYAEDDPYGYSYDVIEQQKE